MRQVNTQTNAATGRVERYCKCCLKYQELGHFKLGEFVKLHITEMLNFDSVCNSNVLDFMSRLMQDLRECAELDDLCDEYKRRRAV